MKYYIFVCSLVFAVSLAWATPAPSTSPASVTLNFPQNDVGDILSLYASLTHYKIIRDSVRYGPITLSVAEPLTPQKAIDIIEKTLFTNGFTIIQVDADTVEIDGPAKNPRANGVPTVTAASQLPTQERLVSFVFSFKHRDAHEMQRIFGQYLSPPRGWTSFIAEPKSNTVVVTERTSVIRGLIEISAKMDTPDWKKEP